MLAHVPSFGRNPRGSPDFLAYPVPKACMHVLGTRVPRRLGVARSASSPKAAQALGCSLTPGLRISFGRVTCMARAASVPGLWALGFLLLACVCGWVRVAVGRGFCSPLPVVAGVLGGCVWARFVVLSLFCRLFVVFVVGLWCGPAFGTCVVSCAFPLPPVVSGSGVRCGRPGLGCAPPFLAGLSGCVFCAFLFFFFFFFPVAGCPWPGPCGLSPVSFLSGAAGFFFFFFSACFDVPFFRWAAVAGLVLPVLAGWSPCACLGVLSSVPSGWGVWPPSVSLVGGLVAVGCFRAPAPPPFFFFFFPGGGACRAVPPVAFPRLAVALWLVCGVVGPSPLLAEVPVCYSPPLLAGFRCRWLWAVPATPGWGLPGGGVWCVAVVCWWGCGWCVVWLVPRHSWRRFLCATPRHSWLGFASGGVGWAPPLLAGVRWRRCCVVRGVWRWCVGGVVAGVWCGWSLATPGGGSCVLLPATPGWVSLPVVVGGPRHSWLGSACGGGVWCVVCGVWRWCVGGVVAGVWCGWSLATPGGGSCVLLPATPGWVSLPVVVGGPRHSWLGSVGGVAVWCVVCGGGVLVGLWLACGVVGPSPLLAEVPVCYSPPLLAGFRCRWWWAVPATPGWGPLAAVVCGVWCVVCGGGVFVGLWLVCGVVGPSPLLAEVPVCYSPPLLAGFRCRWWWAVPATPGWGPLAAVVCVFCLAGSGGPASRARCGAPHLFLWPLCLSALLGPLRAGVAPLSFAAVAVPRWLGFVVCGLAVAWHLFVCRGSLRVVRALRVCGTRRPSLLGTCPCALVVAGGVPLWRASWPRVVRRASSGPVALGAPVGFPDAVVPFPTPGACAPGFTGRLRRARGGRPRTGLIVPAAGPRRGRGAGLSASYPFGAPRWGCPWRVPPASVLGCVRCGGWRVRTRSLTRPVSRTVRLSTGDSAGAPGLFRVDADTSPCGSEDATPGSRACLRVLALLGRVGRAGLPGAFWCASPFPLAALSFCFAWPPPGWGCPSLFRCCCLSPLVVFLGLPLLGSRLVCVLRLAVGCSLVVAPPPRPPLCLGFSSLLLVALVFFFFFFLLLSPYAPVVSGFLGFPAPGALGLGACVVCFVGLPLLGSPCACPSFVLSPWLLAAPAWLLLPPPPPLCPAVFVLAARCCVPCCAVRPPVRCGAAPRCCALCRPVLCWRVLCCARLVPLLVAPCPLALPVALGPCALRRCVLRCSPALCALCVLSWRGGACCAFPVLSVLCGAVLRCAGALALCCSCGACCCWRLVLWCAAVCCAVSCGVPSCGAGSGGPWLSAGGVFRCRCPCLAAWSASLCLVWFAVVPCFPVSCSVVLCCRVVLWCCALLLCCGAVGACFALLWAVVLCCVVLLVGCAVFGPVVVSACCGALFLALCVPCLLRSVRCGALLCWLWCPASLCRVLCRCAVVWCCAVVPCCRFAVLFVFALPSCGLSCGACVVCAVVGASCCGVSLCVVVSPWAFCGVVVLLRCVVVSCCAVRCPVVSCALCRVLRCRAVLRCCAGWLCCAVVCAAGVCFVLFSFAKNPCRFSVPLKTLFFFFFFENKIKLYTTQHTRVQQDHVRGCALRVTRRS